jgi:hypothetical protein
MAKRYAQLRVLVEEYRPKTIVEIGTWNGKRAVELAAIALAHAPAVEYRGYDLFSNASDESDARELNVKPHHSASSVHARLKDFQREQPDFHFQLFEGDTRQTLEAQAVDFAYIDGGHSVETIRSDFERLRRSASVVLDDYYVPDGAGRIPDLSLYGCNAVVADLQHRVLPIRDPVAGGGCVQMVLIGPPLSRWARARLAVLQARAAFRRADATERRAPAS